MKLNIDDISLADTPINTVIFDPKQCLFSIHSDRIFRISDSTWIDNATIVIRDWKELSVEKHVQEDPFEKGQTFQIDWRKEIETFEIIQEIQCANQEFLSLRGFSKESNSWLTYEFKNYHCEIEAHKISNSYKL